MKLLDFNGVDRRDLGTRPLVSRHRLQELEIFAEPYLVGLLDKHPRDKVQAFTMGDDPCMRDEWAAANPGELSGRELMSAVRNGRLWINVLRTDLSDPSFKELLLTL